MSAALRQITGWQPRKYSMEFEDPLAYNKFVVFALVSSLLVPNAGKLFRQALKDERTKIGNEHRRLRMIRKQRRENGEPRLLGKRIDKLHTALFDSCYSTNATVKTISKSRPPFSSPHWIGEPHPPVDQNPTVELQDLNNVLTSKDIIQILRLGFPFRAMRPQTCTPFRSEQSRSKTRRELGEVVIVKTPFNQMPPEQREQQDAHNRLMRVLKGSQMDGAIYEVIVLGKDKKEVAETRGINAASLAVAVSRKRAEMSPSAL